MKKLITCASLAAVGAAALNAQPVGEPSATKPFSVSAKLRGFYDSNYNTAPSNPTPGYPVVKGESWGVDFAPSAQFNLLQDATTLSVRYDAAVLWYENRPDNRYDWYQVVDIGLTHNFSEKSRIEFANRFSYASQPEVTEPGVVTQFYQTENNNFRNYGGISYFGSLSDSWGYHVGYENTWYDYQEEGPGSYAALLNRIENGITLDMRRMFDPTSTGMIGFQYLGTSMTGDEYLAYQAFYPPGSPMSDYRNVRQYFGFIGWDKEFTSQLSTALRAGGQVADYYNAEENFVTPYGDATLTYKYGEGSMFNVGVKYSIYTSDVADTAYSRGTVLGMKAMTVYGGLIQRLTAQLSAHLRGQWQYMDYIGNGAYAGDTDNWFMADFGLTYTLNEHVAFDAGYLYDNLNSDIPNRAYNRNRAFFGIRATY